MLSSRAKAFTVDALLGMKDEDVRKPDTQQATQSPAQRTEYHSVYADHDNGLSGLASWNRSPKTSFNTKTARLEKTDVQNRQLSLDLQETESGALLKDCVMVEEIKRVQPCRQASQPFLDITRGRCDTFWDILKTRRRNCGMSLCSAYETDLNRAFTVPHDSSGQGSPDCFPQDLSMSGQKSKRVLKSAGGSVTAEKKETTPKSEHVPLAEQTCPTPNALVDSKRGKMPNLVSDQPGTVPVLKTEPKESLETRYSADDWCTFPGTGYMSLCWHPSVIRATDTMHVPTVEAKLCEAEQWNEFHRLGTEMVITKMGSETCCRRMFPALRLKVRGVDTQARYRLWLELVQCGTDKYRYIYHDSMWVVTGTVEEDSGSVDRVYTHPDSPFSGLALLSQTVSFEKVKLTNNTRPVEGSHIQLTSMQKYQPIIHLERVPEVDGDDVTTPAHMKFVFPQTSFIAVTAYQNKQITRLKIARNPFAKGFREKEEKRTSHGPTASSVPVYSSHLLAMPDYTLIYNTSHLAGEDLSVKLPRHCDAPFPPAPTADDASAHVLMTSHVYKPFQFPSWSYQNVDSMGPVSLTKYDSVPALGPHRPEHAGQYSWPKSLSGRRHLVTSRSDHGRRVVREIPRSDLQKPTVTERFSVLQLRATMLFAQQGLYLSPEANESGRVVWDLSFASLNSSLWPTMDKVLGCGTWQSPNHVLFQLACTAMAVGLLAIDSPYGALLLHSLFFLGYLLMSIWSWVILCAPDFFSWNFAFLLLNGVQTMSLMYSIRPVRFCQELEEVYTTIFQPLRVPRSLYKRLVGAEYCTLMTLNEGEYYATQSITKTDKLGLLISGSMNAYSNRTLLHTIKAKQFIDSPEFESSNNGDEKFQVSIVAGGICRYIFWPRQSLEYLLVQEPYLASVLNIVLGRDITNKLYALNERVATLEGSRLDIRLPSVSPNLRTRHDIRKAVAGATSTPDAGEQGDGAAAAGTVLVTSESPAVDEDSDDYD
ncbi:hypothetical protein BaRGS_00015605, partial [Batillaria attramentaria]